MINGVSFQPGQPGSLEQEQQRRQQATGSAQGVQEAIKVLSLRLPKVVGAQSIAPSALLSSQGSGGSPHVDSIVESVMSKMFPGQGSPAPAAPSAAPMMAQSENTPQFGGNIQGGSQPKQEQQEATPSFWNTMPRIIAGGGPGGLVEAPLTGGPVPRHPNLPGVDGGGGFNPGAIAPLPDLREYLRGLNPPPSGNPETPLF